MRLNSNSSTKMTDHQYDNRNRAFLQAFMGRSSMTFEEGQPVLAAIFSAHEGQTVPLEDVTEEHFSSYISAANSAISPFDFEIRSSLRQVTNDANQQNDNTPPTRVYALVNTTSDPTTQLATTHSADEIAFVKRLLDWMFEKNNTRLCEGMVVSSIQAINLRTVNEANRRRSTTDGTQPEGGAAKSLNITESENMMKRLVAEGWLERSSKDYFSLSPRGIMELRGWLVSEYNDSSDGRGNRIKFCAACKELITVGQRCEQRDCGGRLHDHCMRNFFLMQRAEKCPVCKEDWPGDKYVGERAVHAANRRQASSAPQTNGRASSAANGADSASEDDDEEEEG